VREREEKVVDRRSLPMRGEGEKEKGFRRIRSGDGSRTIRCPAGGKKEEEKRKENLNVGIDLRLGGRRGKERRGGNLREETEVSYLARAMSIKKRGRRKKGSPGLTPNGERGRGGGRKWLPLLTSTEDENTRIRTVG